MDLINVGPCELNNYCIFQGVVGMMPDYYRCENYSSPCSPDASNSNLDGTFICNYHLNKYFKILKSSFRIPSGKDNKSFKMLVGQSLLQQTDNDTNKNKVLIPLDHELYLKTSSRNSVERMIIYTIYNDKEKIKDLCDILMKQEFFEQPAWAAFQITLNTIMGLVNPSMLCERLTTNKENRVFNNETYYNQFSPFLKNLINRLVRPITMTINNYVIKIDNVDTCNFTSDGLTVPDLHNPNQPVRLDNKFMPKFSIRTVVEFDGLATKEQRVLDSYDEVVLSRPLLNGTQTFL
ncbi:vp39-capsid [Adoxophyes orana granulovirus]|uniref:VP39 n=1 Tax=Adoxophyes orana granulovirus TaxID=170617 RepID=Q7T9T4_GVAO|nr:vp39-capsid [Adoxophyes orana granulovirus]AAP85718.1 vp39-capsid [Adoxophyes orana granulovirus]AJA91721.1 VP39 [Adoxophyes orana granulovirus]